MSSLQCRCAHCTPRQHVDSARIMKWINWSTFFIFVSSARKLTVRYGSWFRGFRWTLNILAASSTCNAAHFQVRSIGHLIVVYIYTHSFPTLSQSYAGRNAQNIQDLSFLLISHSFSSDICRAKVRNECGRWKGEIQIRFARKRFCDWKWQFSLSLIRRALVPRYNLGTWLTAAQLTH